MKRSISDRVEWQISRRSQCSLLATMLSCRNLRFFVLFSALLFSGCFADPEVTLRVGTILWPGYEPLFLARSLGYYGDLPITLVEYPSATEVIRAFENHTIDVATLTGDEVLRLAANEQLPQIVLIMDYSAGADVILARNDIPDLKSLRNKRVGMEPNALGAYMLTRGLESVGLQPKDVQIVPLRIFESDEALQKGDVDAVVTFEPYRTRSLASGAHILFDSNAIPGEIFDTLCIRKESLLQRRSIIQSLVNAWFRALDYLEHNPGDAAQRMAVREAISSEQFLSALNGIRIPTRAETVALLNATNPALRQSIDRLMQVMVDRGLLRHPVRNDTLLEPTFVAGDGE